MLDELRRVDAPCIFVKQAPPAQIKMWLADHSQVIGRALECAERAAMVILLYIRKDGTLEARRHVDRSVRYSILGNGKRREKS